jgi:uncharacterized membrane protein
MTRDFDTQHLRRLLASLPWHRINCLWVIAAISLAGIIHIVTVLVLPYVAERDAWTRLSAITPLNQMAVLNASRSTKLPLPFLAPDAVYAACRFDLTEKNVALRLNILDPAWMVAVYTPQGENFYAMFGSDAKSKSVRLLLLPHDRLARETVSDKTEDGDDQVLVISPSTAGILLIQAPVRGDVFMPATAEALKAAACEPQKPTDARVLAQAREAPPPPKKEEPRPQRRRRITVPYDD